MEQMKELEKQKGNPEGQTPSFVLIADVENGGNGQCGSRNSDQVQSKGNIIHFNPKVEFPIFDVSNPRNWIKKCAKHFNLCKIPDDQKTNLALMYLQGRVQIRFNSYILIRKHVDWDDFIVHLCARFRGDMGRQVVEEFSKLHQIGELDDYLEILKNLRHYCCLRIPPFPMSILQIVSLGG